jgi:hypothetical protein
VNVMAATPDVEASASKAGLAPFFGNVQDFAMCDQSKTALFGAIGRTRGLFNGVDKWPDLQEAVQQHSAALLTTGGEEVWRQQGGILDHDGRPTFRPTAIAAANVVAGIAESGKGLLWTDDLGFTWAVRLVPASGSVRQTFHGFAISWPGIAHIVKCRSLSRHQPAVGGGPTTHGAADNSRAREGLARAARNLWLFERAEQCLWAIHAAVLQQRASLVLLPDVMLGQIVCGADRSQWPQRWRQHAFSVLRSLTTLCWSTLRLTTSGWQPQFGAHAVAVSFVEDLKVNRPNEDFCRPVCALYDSRAVGNSAVRHGHFMVGIGYGFLGVLELFATGSNSQGIRTFDFTSDGGSRKDQVTAARNAGEIITVHMPTKLLGPKAGLSEGQRRIHQALVREMGRLPKKKAAREGQARLIQGNRVPGTKSGAWLHCPFLQPDRRYLDLNGNGRRPGQGYRAIGGKGTGWLHKAGYPIPVAERELQKVVCEFLQDLQVLATGYDLIACGLNPVTAQWVNLETMIAMAQGSPGWRTVDGLHLRVYGPEDYLQRWRQHLATRTGFAEIPGGLVAPWPDTTAAAPVAVATGDVLLDLQVWMKTCRVTQKELAGRLGVSDAFVCQLLKRKKRIPPGTRRKVEALLGSAAAGEDHREQPSQHPAAVA